MDETDGRAYRARSLRRNVSGLWFAGPRNADQLLGCAVAILTLILVAAVAAPWSSDRVTPRPQRGPVSDLRIVNYYPAAHPWPLMWDQFEPATIDRDFAKIHDLHANAVRVIIDPYAVGWPAVSHGGAAHISTVLQLAARHDLKVQLTLFDWFHDWADISDSQAWIHSLATRVTGLDNVALLEVHNEVDPYDQSVMDWVRATLSAAHAALPSVPLTVSVSGSAGATGVDKLLSAVAGSLLQVVDVHLYGDTATQDRVLDHALTDARGRPVVVGESGYPAAGQDRTAEAAQAAYFAGVERVCRAHGIATFAPWTLNDVDASALATLRLRPQEGNFGLLRTDGSAKPAVAVVEKMFTTAEREQLGLLDAAAGS